MVEKRTDTLSYLIRQWIKEHGGQYTSRQIDSDLNIITSEGKAVRRAVIKEECDAKRSERLPNTTGVYRVIDTLIDEMDWQSADPKNVVPLKFPFGLEKYVKIFPKSIVIVAGTKNSGKTLFLYLVTLLNMDKFSIDLYNSETGREQMKERLDAIDPFIPEPAPFKTWERYDNFADIINPDHISIIDYLDTGSEAYVVGDEIDRIFRKKKNGVAIIGLQKPPGRDLAYGKGATEKRAVLYIVLDNAKTEYNQWGKEIKVPRTLKILHAKNPADPIINPNNMRFEFSINGTGSAFKIIKSAISEESFLDE